MNQMIATDGRRLTCRALPLPMANSLIVPTTKFLLWSGLQGPHEIGVRTEQRKKETHVLGLALRRGPWFYWVKAIDCIYPNWRQVIPSTLEQDHRIIFTDDDVAALRKILPSFPGLATYNARIELRAGPDGKLVLVGKGRDDVTDTTLTLSGGSAIVGNLPSVVLNGLFLMEALDAGFRTFTTQDTGCPLRADDQHGGIHVLMPLSADKHPPKPADPAPETVPESPAQVPPITETTTPPVNTVAAQENTMNDTKIPPTALESLQAAFEIVKAKAKETNLVLAEVADAIKLAIREDRQRRNEVETVRAGLQKLQAIKV